LDARPAEGREKKVLGGEKAVVTRCVKSGIRRLVDE
jgi:hypothetical protein